MRLFLDTSVLLAAAGSANGASCFVVVEAQAHRWELVASDHCHEETRRNLPKMGRPVATAWSNEIVTCLRFVPTSLALDKPLVFPKAKDRPVLISALAARSDWLLTLDQRDFHLKLGREVYGLRIATPGEFLVEQRARGVL